MQPLRIECLGCGSPREVGRQREGHPLDAGECLRCGYVGWAPSSVLTEALRRRIREQPPDRRIALFPL